MTNIDSILKSRDITLPTKVRPIRAMVFPVVMYGCESWTIKKAERWRIDAFELWCWRRLWRVPWTTRRSNQSILKEISPEYSLEGLMLKDWNSNTLTRDAKCSLIGKDPDAGTIEGRRRSERQMVGWHHQLNWHMSLSKLRELVMDREAGELQSTGSQSDTTERLNWTELSCSYNSPGCLLETCLWIFRRRH